MDWISWAIQMPQLCCVLPTILIIVLMVVGFGVDIANFLLNLILLLLSLLKE